MVMRFSSKGEITGNPLNQIFGVDFHDFMQQENSSSNLELAQEFGVTLRSVKEMKKRVERN
jgi:hypothetical protein